MPMARLKVVMQSSGCSDVQSYIQSGNVVFSSSVKSKTRLTLQILEVIESEFGFRPQVMLLNKAEFREAIENNPFDVNGKEPHTLHFFFLEEQPSQPDLDGLMKLAIKTEVLELVSKVFYLDAPDGIGKSKLAAAAERLLGVPATARNYNTIKALALMLGVQTEE